jgi:hypothetical protein
MNGLKTENAQSLTQRTKLVKVQDSIIIHEDEVMNPEITIKQVNITLLT